MCPLFKVIEYLAGMNKRGVAWRSEEQIQQIIVKLTASGPDSMFQADGMDIETVSVKFDLNSVYIPLVFAAWISRPG